MSMAHGPTTAITLMKETVKYTEIIIIYVVTSNSIDPLSCPQNRSQIITCVIKYLNKFGV